MLEGYLLAIYASYLPFIGGKCPEDLKIDNLNWPDFEQNSYYNDIVD